MYNYVLHIDGTDTNLTGHNDDASPSDLIAIIIVLSVVVIVCALCIVFILLC